MGQIFTDFEFVIVDDGAEDTAVEIIRSYVVRDARMQFVPLAEHGGEAVARNACLAAAKGHYIAGMDCDDISLPDRLRTLVDFLQSNPDFGSIGVSFRTVNSDLSPLDIHVLRKSHAQILVATLVSGLAVCRASLIIRRHFLDDSGYRLDSGLGCDSEFFLRLVWPTEIRYHNLRTILYIYRRHEASISSELVAELSPGRVVARREALESLWCESPSEKFRRFEPLRPGKRLSMIQKRLARRGYKR